MSQQERFAEIDEKIAALEAEKAEMREAVLEEGRQRCEAIASEYGMTVAELFGFKKTRKGRGTAKPKYRDPKSGKTWSGRGRAPKWIDEHEQGGGSREELAV